MERDNRVLFFIILGSGILPAGIFTLLLFEQRILGGILLLLSCANLMTAVLISGRSRKLKEPQ
jgi:hypothetical protein